MLRFHALTIKNFGPFKGEQTIEFLQNNGVTIVWGFNGRGKTTLLNVFRYALFKTIKGRRGENVDYLALSNLEAVEDGEYGFSIKLTMSNDSDRFVLIRDVHPREGIRYPKSNEDFIEDCFLKKNGAILSPSDREHELSLIMPQDISRFFLFDGELLQEYETLLDDDSNDGMLIKSSIEKILGMPILTNGKKDISELVAQYVTAKNKAAQNDKNTAEFANAIATLIDEINGHSEEIEKLQKKLAEEQERLGLIKKRMDETEKLRELVARETAQQGTVNGLRNQRELVSSEVQAGMKTAWQGMIRGIVNEQIEQIRLRIEEYNRRESIARTSHAVLHEVENAVRTHHCGICDQEISGQILYKLEVRLAELKNNTPRLSEEERAELNRLQIRLQALQKIAQQRLPVSIKMKIEQLKRIDIQISDAEQSLREVQSKIRTYGDYDPSMLSLASDYSKCQASIGIIKAGIAEEQKAKDSASERQAKLDKQVTQLAKNRDVLSATTRLELCKKIEDIFALGVDRYRKQLKENVQVDASRLFTRMSADKDYSVLQINDNYGLEIIHKKGVKVEGRSAGYEHVVALALIGALHKNAPLQGPVIMDSPFGRLDPAHKKNVTMGLPELSDQVILLVYDGEIDPQAARELLGGNLLREYHLNRVTSFHTRID